MMLALHGVSLALQVAVPVLLLGWLARGRSDSISGWLARATTIVLYIGAVHVAGLWMIAPWYTAAVFVVGLVAIGLLQVRRVQQLPWRAARVAWGSLIGGAIIATCTVAALVAAAVGRRVPGEHVVDLQFPLRNGVYYVVAGGSVELLNPHLMTLTAERFRAYRGQSYGVDLVKLGAFGLRASGVLPSDPARYAIYGDPVYAPCSGTVAQSADGAPDMPPPQPDRTRMPGNHVLLDCGTAQVLLAHLKPGTVRARPRQRIEAGALIGVVGNSGNSNEPHLHVHAQRPAAAGREPLSGDPLPMTFNGRYLVRNDRLTSEAVKTEQ